jgi:hypothetical protein
MSYDHWKTTEDPETWEYPDVDALSEYDDWIDSLQQSDEFDQEERSGANQPSHKATTRQDLPDLPPDE